jgi:hypothetical protein
MKSLIKYKNSRGMMELLILLPLFLGLVCVMAWLGFLLLARTKMEKHAWVLQTQQSYRIDNDAKFLNSKYKIGSNRAMSSLFDRFRGLIQDLPSRFYEYIQWNPTEYKKLTLQNNGPSVLNYFYSAAFRQREDITPYSFSSDMLIPGNAMDHASVTEMLIWQDSMDNAGFDYPFYLLGIKELLDLPGLPMSKLGEFAGILKKSDEQLKNEVME